MNLEQLKQEEQQISKLLEENRDKQKHINATIFIEKNGFNFGDVIKFLDNKREKIGIIKELYFVGVNPYFYMVQLYNSNGELGKREVTLYESNLKTAKLINAKIE